MMNLYTENFTGPIYHARDQWGNPINEIATVGGWIPFWREEPAAVILRPEMQVIDAVAPFLDPPRTNGVRGLKVFKLSSRHDAGYWKQFVIPAGVTSLTVTATGHHWYSQRDNAHLSEYEKPAGQWHTIHNGERGATLLVGIDPDGGTDPWAKGVVWEQGNIYDHFSDVALTVEDFGALVTVFIRSTQLYPFKHSDAYWSGVTIAGDGAPCGACPGKPRVDYKRVYNVWPPDATPEQRRAVAQYCADNQETGGPSYDDAGIGDLTENVARLWYIPTAKQPEMEAWYAQWYPGTWVLFAGDAPTPPDPPDPPKPPIGWTPRNYVAKGTKLSFHCFSYPVDFLNQLTAAGVTLSSTKLVQSIGGINDAREPFVIGRMIDTNDGAVNLEWFDYTLGHGTPEQQADLRMSLLMPIFSPYKAKLTHIELINEQDPHTGANHVLLARFYIRAMDIANANGFKIALFSHSLGTPEPYAWDAIANTGVFEKAAAGGHAIALHEYGDASGGPNSIIGRYRYPYEHIILPRGLNIPLFITEYNVTDDMFSGDVFGQWVAYDNIVRKDPYVAGVHIFTVGSGMGWDNYHNITVAQFPKFKDYAIAQKDRANG